MFYSKNTVEMLCCSFKTQHNEKCLVQFPSLNNYGVCLKCIRPFCSNHMHYSSPLSRDVSKGICFDCLVLETTDLKKPTSSDTSINSNFFLNPALRNIDYYSIEVLTSVIISPNVCENIQ